MLGVVNVPNIQHLAHLPHLLWVLLCSEHVVGPYDYISGTFMIARIGPCLPITALEFSILKAR